VRAVTLDDVRAAAKKYLHPDALVQVVVAPAAKLAEQGITSTPAPNASTDTAKGS
jgi:hypothetical protein